MHKMRTSTQRLKGVKRRGSDWSTGIIKEAILKELALKNELRVNSDIKESNQVREYSINKGTKT